MIKKMLAKADKRGKKADKRGKKAGKRGKKVREHVSEDKTKAGKPGKKSAKEETGTAASKAVERSDEFARAGGSDRLTAATSAVAEPAAGSATELVAGSATDPGPEVLPSQAFSLHNGITDPALIPTSAAPIGPQSKEEAAAAMAELGPRLSDLQERLYAAGTAGDRRRVLLLLQGMDTSGKDGVTRHVIGQVDPAGVHLTSFKQPTAEELAHDFLWRIEQRLPGRGIIGVFNRSQYEDVLIVRVHELVSREVWSRRYAAINAFERRVSRSGVTLVKCFLHVSPEVQRERLAARLDDPTKYWKYNPADVDERGLWSDYQEAYADALRRCNTVAAPWYVIPSDCKWYRNWAVAALLAQKLTELDPQYPPAGFDVAQERARVAAS